MQARETRRADMGAVLLIVLLRNFNPIRPVVRLLTPEMCHQCGRSGVSRQGMGGRRCGHGPGMVLGIFPTCYVFARADLTQRHLLRVPTMKITPFRELLLAGVLCAVALNATAQVVELRATINQAQETPPTGSPATGTAIMLYDVGANTFDLVVTINNLANTALASHIHEAAVGVPGSVVSPLGAETSYTRNGNTLTATFRGLTYGGNKLTLLQGGAYYNIHSAQFPNGEVRGQLIARPKRLVANFDVAQEQAAFPAVNLTGANLKDFGAAVIFYDPVANRISVRSSVYNFTNVLNNSHFHEGAPGVSGAVVTSLGNNANATFSNGGSYNNTNGVIAGTFDIPYTGDPIKLLTGGAYMNFHSTTFAGGELRGQVRASDEIPGTRFANLSVRGFVGAADQVLIQGITVNGPDPMRVLITAKGPSLSAFGVSTPLANPLLSLYDSGGRRIAFNDDVGTVAAGSEMATIPGVPANPVESALVVVLPPGNYTAIVSSSTGTTGIALLEVSDLRNLNGTVTAADADVLALLRDPQRGQRQAREATAARSALELCVGVPLTLAAVTR
jgi:hypothetical protein